MPKIVSLSSIIQLRPISSGVEAFAKLCDKYSQGCCSPCCPSVFTQLSNAAWVIFKYRQNLNTTINPYKLGKLTTEEFLDRMLDIFSFLKDEHLVFPQEEIDRLWKNKKEFIALKNSTQEGHLSNREIALALIEEAWSAIINFEDADAVKFESVVSAGEPTYFVSNTNELNVNKILNLLRGHFLRIQWCENIDISVRSEKPIEVAPNIYLYLSHQVGSYKTDVDNHEVQNSTPSLFKKLIGQLEVDLSKIEVISQYPKDLEEASRLGVPDENLYKATNYYPKAMVTIS